MGKQSEFQAKKTNLFFFVFNRTKTSSRFDTFWSRKNANLLCFEIRKSLKVRFFANRLFQINILNIRRWNDTTRPQFAHRRHMEMKRCVVNLFQRQKNLTNSCNFCLQLVAVENIGVLVAHLRNQFDCLSKRRFKRSKRDDRG